MRDSLIRIWSIAIYTAKPILRNPLTFLTILIWPMVPIFFLGVFLGEEGVRHGLIGMMVAGITFSGIYVAQDYVFNRTISKLQDFLVASPVKQIEYIIGVSIGSLIFGIPGTIIGLAIIWVTISIDILRAAIVIAILMFGALTLFPLGFIIGTRYDDAGRVNGLTNILAIVLGLLPPVYYALDYIPGEYRIYTYFLPTTHVAHLIRITLGLTDVMGLGIVNHTLGLMVFASIFYLVGLRVGRWREV